MAEQKKTKAQMMQDACALYGQLALQRVEDVEPLEVYVKTFTVKEFQDILARVESFHGRYDDGYNAERGLALELFDADGKQLFDPENMEDVLFLAGIPWAVRNLLSQAAVQANSGAILKKLLTSGSVL